MSIKSLKSELSHETQKLLKGKNVVVNSQNTDNKYSKHKFIQIYRGYDMLENMFTVRTYIQKKHKIDIYLFEILLKLMGLGLFTQRDFFDTPRPFTYMKWSSIVETGYLNLVMDHESADKKIYGLNTKAKNIVIDFYECLCGEKKIPLDSSNPMVDSETKIAYDKRKIEIIKKLNSLPVPDHKRFLFED